jgi:hypothetical protein
MKCQNIIFSLYLCAFARQSLQVGEPPQRAALPLRELDSYFQSVMPKSYSGLEVSTNLNLA